MAPCLSLRNLALVGIPDASTKGYYNARDYDERRISDNDL
jgi:hypothetical protein